jgi:hypothetical protein
MAEKYVYQLSAQVLGSISRIKQYHFADVTISCHGTGPCTDEIASALEQNGITPICTGGNDYTSTCGNAANAQCYQLLANRGWQAAGGEATDRAEMMAAQQYITYETFGGCYGAPNIDPFTMANFEVVPGGHGVIAYLESYCNSTLLEQETINACIHAWQKGCAEVGVMIGWWMNRDATPYMRIAEAVAKATGKFSGFSLWLGCNKSTDDTINSWESTINTLQGSFPPDTRMLRDRLKGTPGGPITPPKDYSGVYSMMFD